MANDRHPQETIVVYLVGDVGPRRIEYGEEPESLFALVPGRIREADISFCQLEYNLSTRGCLQWRYHNTWYGRVSPENVKSLVFAGFNVVSHAANHAFDYGPEALLETIDVLRGNNMQVVGAGRDLIEARKPAIVERRGIRVGFLAYISILPAETEAREEKPGCNPIRVSTYYESNDFAPGMPPKIITVPVEEDVEAMEEDIRKLRRQVDVVVVSMHWGMHHLPGAIATYQPKVGRRAINAGADIVIGHHPHIINGIEMYKGRPIFYSLGNFGMETPWHQKPPPGVRGARTQAKYRKWQPEPGWERYSGHPDQRYSMLVKCIVGRKGVQKVSFLPSWINQRAEPRILSRSDEKFLEVVRYIEPWCQERGTALSQEGDEIVVSTLPGTK
ncbi:MAG: CapA family protein [Chloroflexi bacterium]|nr:CapA family protein [Chloroflexota bacterium]